MPIERRFAPDPEAMECLVEVLYSLLTEVPDDRAEHGESAVSEASPAPCVSGEREP